MEDLIKLDERHAQRRRQPATDGRLSRTRHADERDPTHLRILLRRVSGLKALAGEGRPARLSRSVIDPATTETPHADIVG
jgi:hypothetical protein